MAENNILNEWQVNSRRFAATTEMEVDELFLKVHNSLF
jgi:hypothetical protein